MQAALFAMLATDAAATTRLVPEEFGSTGQVTIRHCTIAYHSAIGPGGNLEPGGSVRVESSIVACASQGIGVAGRDSEITCSDIFGNVGGDAVGGTAGGGSFSLDPGSCNATQRRLSLHASSPCVAGHHSAGSDCGQIGASAQTCDGCPTVTSSWGALRARFRPGVKQ